MRQGNRTLYDNVDKAFYIAYAKVAQAVRHLEEPLFFPFHGVIEVVGLDWTGFNEFNVVICQFFCASNKHSFSAVFALQQREDCFSLMCHLIFLNLFFSFVAAKLKCPLEF